MDGKLDTYLKLPQAVTDVNPYENLADIDEAGYLLMMSHVPSSPGNNLDPSRIVRIRIQCVTDKITFVVTKVVYFIMWLDFLIFKCVHIIVPTQLIMLLGNSNIYHLSWLYTALKQ